MRKELLLTLPLLIGCPKKPPTFTVEDMEMRRLASAGFNYLLSEGERLNHNIGTYYCEDPAPIEGYLCALVPKNELEPGILYKVKVEDGERIYLDINADGTLDFVEYWPNDGIDVIESRFDQLSEENQILFEESYKKMLKSWTKDKDII